MRRHPEYNAKHVKIEDGQTESNIGPYSPVTPREVEELRAIVGEQNVIFGDADRMVDYSHDEIPDPRHAHMPEVVVEPSSADEISKIMKLANRARIPVTPRGAGSGLSGGAVPVFGGILLSTERMNRILEIDRTNMVVVVEPGVVTNAINDAVAEYGLFYAGYPMSLEMCFIGGNVAENAGGGRAIKYGVTGRYVMGLEVVLPTGEILHLGGKRVKDVTGYDLVHLLVGSEGTLGIFTKVWLRLMPQPVARAVVLVPFPDVQSAIGVVPQIMTLGRMIPASVEFMDRLSIDTAYAYVGDTPPVADAGAMLLLEVDAFTQGQVESEYSSMVQICLDGGALDAFVGDTPAKMKKMWHPRQSAAEAFKAMSVHQSGEDPVVPMGAIPEFVSELDRLASKFDVLTPCFGHAGDGNLHVHVLKKDTMPVDEWDRLLPDILTDLYRLTAALGGTISGEHGIGSKRTVYLPIVLEPATIALHRRIKQAFDPLNILNPGKILP